jgi:hypothetical protein
VEKKLTPVIHALSDQLEARLEELNAKQAGEVT